MSRTEVSTKCIDHIVHLTPPGSVEETSQQFRELGFNVIPGGTHADGLTANALVVLSDGVYLELISFTHPPTYYPPNSPERQKREAHAWASKSPGWIDYAFLGNGSQSTRISDIINARAKADGSGTVYLPEQSGGRTRPDGVVLKWLISAPKSHPRGALPFFCGDVTPRSLRVPSDPPANTRHPSTALGIAHIRILVEPAEFASLARSITSVVGDPPISQTSSSASWVLGTPVSSASNLPCRLLLETPSDELEHEVVFKNTGIYEVAFWVSEAQEEGEVLTPYGKIVWKHVSGV